MNQMIYTAPKLNTVVHYKPGGPMVDLLRDHLTNMTEPQRQVCASVVSEWNQMVERIAFLESENQKLTQDVARLTHEVTALRGPESSPFGNLMALLAPAPKPETLKRIAAKRAAAKRASKKRSRKA